MKVKCHNPEQINRKLRNPEQLLNQGQTVADVCRVGHKPQRPNSSRSLSWRTHG